MLIGGVDAATTVVACVVASALGSEIAVASQARKHERLGVVIFTMIVQRPKRTILMLTSLGGLELLVVPKKEIRGRRLMTVRMRQVIYLLEALL